MFAVRCIDRNDKAIFQTIGRNGSGKMRSPLRGISRLLRAYGCLGVFPGSVSNNATRVDLQLWRYLPLLALTVGYLLVSSVIYQWSTSEECYASRVTVEYWMLLSKMGKVHDSGKGF